MDTKTTYAIVATLLLLIVPQAQGKEVPESPDNCLFTTMVTRLQHCYSDGVSGGGVGYRSAEDGDRVEAFAVGIYTDGRIWAPSIFQAASDTQETSSWAAEYSYWHATDWRERKTNSTYENATSDPPGCLWSTGFGCTVNPQDPLEPTRVCYWETRTGCMVRPSDPLGTVDYWQRQLP